VSVNGTSVATSGVANITSVPASILSGAIPSAVTATTQNQGDNSTKIATTAYVDTAITSLPEPMVFKGSLGTGGTITTLPTASSSNEGYTYKVITAGTYASQAAKVGDTFISDGSAWVLIPSGDEPSGTVTSVTIKATSPINIDSSSAITTSGTRTLSHANSGVTAGTYRSVTVNATGHVTAGTNPTTLSGYGITDAKIANGVITLGSNTITPLTSFTETDPVFSASAAAGISSTDITNWNNKTSNTGTVTSVTIKANSPITVDSTSAITGSGTRTLSHSNSGVTAGTYRSVTVNATGHVTAGTNPTTLSGYGITDAKIANGTITLGSNTITPLTSYTETDPVFSASAASGITSSDITNWNNKTSNVGTITGIKMNGASKGTSGVVDLGTVITAH
jgi:phage-related tail fiber protein